MARVWSEEHKLRLAGSRAGSARCLGRAGCRPGRRCPVGEGASCRSDARTRSRARGAHRPRPRRLRGRRWRGLDTEGRRWLHYGLTSSDVLDTALALQVGEAGALLVQGLDRAFEAVVGRAEEHRRTLIMGRTHGIHAEPTTFGLKLAGWAFELDRGRARLGVRSKGCGSASSPAPSARMRPPARARAARLRAAEARARAPLHAGHPARPARSCSRRSPWWPPHSTPSASRSVTWPAPRCARSRSRSPPARRAPRPCHKRNPITAERICGLARSCAARRTSASRTCTLARARHLAFVGRARRHPRRVPRPRLHARPVRVARRRPRRPHRAHAREPRREPRPHLQPAAAAALVESGLERDEAYRIVQRLAMEAWDGGRDFRELAAADEVAARVDLAAVFDLEPYTQHVDVVFDRLEALRGADRCLNSSPAARFARSTRSTTSACCRRLRPRLDLRRRAADGGARQGPRADGPFGVLVRAHGTHLPNHLLAMRPDGRSMECRRLEMLPLECVVAATSRAPAGRTTSRRGRCAATRFRKGCASRIGFRRRSSRRRRRPRRATTRTSTPRKRSSSSARTASARLERLSLELYRFASDKMRRSAGSSSPTRSSSSGSTERANRARRRGVHARLVPLLAGGRVRAGGPQPSFDKQFVRDYCETLGWDKTPPGPGAAGRRRRRHARALHVEAFEAAHGHDVRRLPRRPRVVLR